MRVPDAAKTMKTLAFVAIVVCLALFAATVWYDRSLKAADPFGYRNLKACSKLRPGVTETELAATLGAPEKVEESGGLRRLFFHTLSVASEPIQADVDPASAKVLELRCRDDGAPTWTLRR